MWPRYAGLRAGGGEEAEGAAGSRAGAQAPGSRQPRDSQPGGPDPSRASRCLGAAESPQTGPLPV